MNLTITITDEQLARLKENLKVSARDYERLEKGGVGLDEYPMRIILARKALDLSTYKSECVKE